METIILKLKEKGITPTGCYETLPQVISDAVDFVNQFGFSEWEKTSTAGKTTKQIVSELSKI